MEGENTNDRIYVLSNKVYKWSPASRAPADREQVVQLCTQNAANVINFLLPFQTSFINLQGVAEISSYSTQLQEWCVIVAKMLSQLSHLTSVQLN